MEGKMNIAVFAGSFDPLTIGHYDIALRASSLFDEVIVLVNSNVSKHSLFSVEARVRMAQAAFSSMDRIRVESFDGLTVSFLDRVGARFLIRGIRHAQDLESERALSWNNQKLNSKIETIFLLSAPEHLAVSSSVVRELLSYNQNVDTYVPESMREILLSEWRKIKCSV